MVHIKKVKTWHGLRYAVVEPFTSTTFVEDKNGNKVSKVVTEDLVVEYKQGDKVFPAVFPVTPEGLEEAKYVQSIFKKKDKK